jgi:hypothetical protein
MNLNEHTALELRHFLSSIEESLRPLLQTKNFIDINPEYWINSLKRFKGVIDNILGSESDVYKQLYLKHFQILLANPPFEYDLPKLFETTQKITDEVWNKLTVNYE